MAPVCATEKLRRNYGEYLIDLISFGESDFAQDTRTCEGALIPNEFGRRD